MSESILLSDEKFHIIYHCFISFIEFIPQIKTGLFRFSTS
jgi:hypothetical protein